MSAEIRKNWPKQLLSDRIQLRRFLVSDAADLAREAGCMSVVRYTLGIPHPYSVSSAREWIRGCKAREISLNEFVYAITSSDTQTLLGAISVSMEPEHRRAEIGYWLAENARGKGYAGTAVDLTLQSLFSLSLNRVYALVFPDNADSIRLLTKLGFKREGRLKRHVVKWEESCDVLSFGLTADTFARHQRKKELEACSVER